jgi:hypothetical protein
MCVICNENNALTSDDAINPKQSRSNFDSLWILKLNRKQEKKEKKKKKMKLFERSSKDSAILRRAFAAKKPGRAVRFEGDDSRAGGVDDDEVMKLNRAHDAAAFDRGARRGKRAADATRQQSVLNIAGMIFV